LPSRGRGAELVVAQHQGEDLAEPEGLSLRRAEVGCGERRLAAENGGRLLKSAPALHGTDPGRSIRQRGHLRSASPSSPTSGGVRPSSWLAASASKGLK